VDGTCSAHGEMRNAYKIVDAEGKKLFARPWHRWKDNINMDLRETGLEVWIGVMWPGPATCPCVHVYESLGSIKRGKFLYQRSVLLYSQEEACSMELVIFRFLSTSRHK
jgi:hypothetical protein